MKKITTSMLEDSRPIVALQIGDPDAGHVLAVNENGITALMLYAEADGSLWIAVVGHAPMDSQNIVAKREEIRARMNLEYVSNIVYMGVQQRERSAV